MQVKAVEERLKEYDGLKKKLEESERLEKYYRQTLTEKDNEIEKLHTECDGLSESLGLFEKERSNLRSVNWIVKQKSVTGKWRSYKLN